ncbi:HDOD domain-containing protein [Undibacterium squillarum]|uniref:HDOD domain-containing protein n=1 Tax=Undibacterium squillarum TaxID=1131567 RepID=A0ABQ2XS94_9BURK|nr:HDOD domain-containing protein [Undibacterium squillarum]GGX31233.1 hypothetical protein GCM10010946_05420 [Undibacterium squillarum]
MNRTAIHEPVPSLAKLQTLPVMPGVLRLLFEAGKQENPEPVELSHLIALDPGLTAKLLRLTNASHFGTNSKVVTADQAAALLGSNQLLQMAAVTSHHNPASLLPADALEQFWRRSIATAFCAKAIARTHHMKHDYAYTAGLLHRCGDLVRMLYPDLHTTTSEGNIPLTAIQAGTALARQWQFADTLTDALTHFTAPPDDPHQLLASVVHLAEAFVTALDICGDKAATLPLLSTHAWDTLALTEAECLQVFRETEMHALATFDLLQI